MDPFLSEYWAIFKGQFTVIAFYVWIAFLIFLGWPRAKKIGIAILVSILALPLFVMLNVRGWIII